jgi:hypothetical protein
MKDEWPVRRFHEIIGIGHVHFTSGLWWWRSGSKRDAQAMEVLLPWLSIRRQRQVEDALSAATLMDPAVKSQRCKDAFARQLWAHCECGRGPMPPGALARHRKACEREGIPVT